MKKLKNLDGLLIDFDKISFVGKPDTIVKSHIGVVIHFFKIIVDGHPVEIQKDTYRDIELLRNEVLSTFLTDS
jgi:hypothetical protein